jgi:hypothetical protein
MDFNTFNTGNFQGFGNNNFYNPFNYMFNLERNVFILSSKVNDLYEINNNVRYNFDKCQSDMKELILKNDQQNEFINKLKKEINYLKKQNKNSYKKYLALENKYNEISSKFEKLEKDFYDEDDIDNVDEENNEEETINIEEENGDKEFKDNVEELSETEDEDDEEDENDNEKKEEDKKEENEEDGGETDFFKFVIQNIIKNKITENNNENKPAGSIIIMSNKNGPNNNNEDKNNNPLLTLIRGMVDKDKKETENISNENQEYLTQFDFSKLEKYDVQNIDASINDINDLICLAEKYPIEKRGELKLEKVDGLYEYDNKYYSINLEVLNKLVKPLTFLNKMIGLTPIKKQILDMILYYMQEFEKGTSNMLHTIIEGPPGVGKTEIGKILAEIYSALGIIPSNKFKLVKRTDLIGEYVGHTAHKTQKAIDEAEGGVLFIDEAYSLGGGSEKSDTFSKECLDVLNQNLSENKKKLIVIIAGYKDQLESSFFCYNPGLKRRFPFKYTIDGYSSTELKDIYHKKLSDINWSLDKDVTDKFLCKFFSDNKEEFKNYGGDIENFILNSKFTHSKRVFNSHPYKRKILNKDDFESAFERFKKNKKNREDPIPMGLYI